MTRLLFLLAASPAALAAIPVALAAGPAALAAESVPATAAAPVADDVRQAIARGLDFLLKSQNRDGSWGGPRNKTFTDSFANYETHHAWIVGTTGVVCLALLAEGKSRESDAALERGLRYIVANAALKRPAEWDVDNVWGLIYGLQALAQALSSPRFSGAGSSLREDMRKAGSEMLAGLNRYQSPDGGWGYYASAVSAWRPAWATSFTTAVAVLALLDAKKAGLRVDEKVLRGAVRAVKRCQLPNGAYSYDVMAVPRTVRLDFINQVKGSLSRLQVCNLALYRAGENVDHAALRRGMDLFLKHHKFLDVALRKPIPHEAYYYVAAYFYLFGHCYAAEVVETLPAGERASYWPAIQRDVLKTQESDGGMWDFWISSHTKPYGTAFSILALGRSVR